MKRHVDERGTLEVIEEAELPFRIRRVFWVREVPQGARRGGHAHEAMHEWLACLRGGIEITGDEQATLHPGDAFLIRPGVRVWLEAREPDTAWVVLAEAPYES